MAWRVTSEGAGFDVAEKTHTSKSVEHDLVKRG
jgi:hypothetical protein